MDIVFSDVSSPSTVLDHQALLRTLQQATKWASSSSNEIIASFIQPLNLPSSTNPLSLFHIFQELQLGECIFWSRPAEKRAFVGVGSVATIETQGTTSISAAALAW